MRGHIRKRGSTYQITVELGRDPITKKRKQKTQSGYKTKKEAEKALAELIARVEKGEYFEAQKMNLSEYLKKWLDTYAKVNVANSTYKRYTEFANTINNYIGNLCISQLKPANIQQFYGQLIDDKKLSNSTILKIHRMLRLALKHAVRWQIILSNPTDAATPPKPEAVEMKVWDYDTAMHFIEAIRNESIYMPALIAYTTGMRLGEICALQWDKVNLNAGTITVLYSMDMNGELKTPKTKKSRRTIQLMDITITALKEHRKEQMKVTDLLKGKDKDGKDIEEKQRNFVCSWPDGRPINPHYVSEKFAQLVGRIYMDAKKEIHYPKIRFHDLRHSHATLLLQQGVNPKIVSERLGHSQIGLTLDTYSHVLPTMQQDAIEKLNQLNKKENAEDQKEG